MWGEYDWERKLAHIFGGWFADGAQSFPTVMQLDTYDGEVLSALRAGETVRVDDVGLLVAEPAYAAIAAVGVQALLSVPLIVDGVLRVNVSIHQHEPRRWTDEEVALVREVAERLWAEVVRARAEDALRASEDRYRSLFNSVSEGLAINELVRDGSGRVIDARFIDLNPAYEAQTGFERDEAVGRLASEIFPTIGPFWLEMAERVAETGRPERIERLVADNGRWFAFNMAPFEGTDQFVVLYDDITDRKEAEAVLRENQEQQMFLLELSDALRPLVDAAEIQVTAARLLGTHLGVDRAMYGEVTGEPGAETGVIRSQFVRPAVSGRPAPAPFPDRFAFESFGTGVMPRRYSGEGLAVADVDRDPGFSANERASWAAVGVCAAIVAPLVKGRRLVAELGIHSETAREWTKAEISLVREVGERTWAAAERARAEAASRVSEERFRQFAEASSAGLWIRDAAMLDMEYVSPAIGAIYGLKSEDVLGSVEKWAAAILPEDRGTARDHLERARHGQSVVHEFRIQHASDRTVRWLRNTDFPLRDDGHVQRIGGIAEDVTDAKLAIAHRELLLAELQHRVRNILAVIRSIVSRTHDGERSAEDYVQHLQGRLSALARTQVLLTRRAGAGVDLQDMIRDELVAQATRPEQFSLGGPDIELSPKAAEVLTLAIHELATSSTKYGAFSKPAGSMTVEWRTEDRQGEDWLILSWTERNVPIVDAVPRRQGFGTELITRRIPYELKGHGSVSLRPGGLRSTIEFPLQGDSILQTDGVAR